MANVPPPPTDGFPDFSDSPITSSPTNFVPELHRTLSNSSHWSAADTPQHHHQGTSYFPRASSPPARAVGHPILIRNSTGRGGNRSTSVTSSHVAHRGIRDGMLSEEEEEDDDEGSDDQDGRRERDQGKTASHGQDDGDDDGDDGSEHDDDPITLKERQSLINVEHPFGLPIWKPALYKKTRSVTRRADEALHSIPSAQAERHLLPGNIFWVIVFGWWLATVCFTISILMWLVPCGGSRYSSLVFGLGWYLAWPFGKYVEGDLGHPPPAEDEERPRTTEPSRPRGDSDSNTIRALDQTQQFGGMPLSQHATITQSTLQTQHTQSDSWNSVTLPTETASLIPSNAQFPAPIKSYGAILPSETSSFGIAKESLACCFLGKACFWLSLVFIIAPLMLLVCLACWGIVFTIPMAKLNWALINHLFEHPTKIRFCAAPPAVIVSTQPAPRDTPSEQADHPAPSTFSFKHPRLSAGQTAPSSKNSTVLLCTYRAVGWQYYKYTIGGVNIMFINLLPVVLFTIIDGLVLLPMVEAREAAGLKVPIILTILTNRLLIFTMSLASVIPLSYFIGMAVASISAQSSIGMGAVINATFGSVIEVILYGIALTQGKGHLVEGSIVGSLLAGVLLMPGVSMCSGALRRKEQKFNAKSAGVTSMMLIMAFIGTLTPTLFYQTYGSFQLVCEKCPHRRIEPKDAPWICDHCYYEHPDPVDDPFFQSTVKSYMYMCAVVLLFSYLIGLWFSLRTHASQIWQNPRPLLNSADLSLPPNQSRLSLYHRLLHPGSATREPGLNRKPSNVTSASGDPPSRSETPVPRTPASVNAPTNQNRPVSPSTGRRVSYAPPPNVPHSTSFQQMLDVVDQANSAGAGGMGGLQLPPNITTDDFTRAVAVATVSALRQQQAQHAHSPARMRVSGLTSTVESEGGHGHDAPSWSRFTSASVLLGCTALYAAIAEILIDVVDVVLEHSGIDEKFLGITLFALVPNTTEFMNAMSFALNGNIALSMEIGSAYALQVCLLQIPAMVAFSAWYAPEKMGVVSDTFSLIFPRWDALAIILAVFLMTYTYIEAKSNYHRGSILILSYLVLAAGFYFAPHNMPDTIESLRHFTPAPELNITFSTLWQSTKMLTSSLLMQPNV